MYNTYPETDGDHIGDIQAGNPANGEKFIGTYRIEPSNVDNLGNAVSSGWYVAKYQMDPTITVGDWIYDIDVVSEHLVVSDVDLISANPGKLDNADFGVPFQDADGKFIVFTHFEVEYK